MKMKYNPAINYTNQLFVQQGCKVPHCRAREVNSYPHEAKLTLEPDNAIFTRVTHTICPTTAMQNILWDH